MRAWQRGKRAWMEYKENNEESQSEGNINAATTFIVR